MAELSPAAQAVLDAMRRSCDHEQTRRAIAAEILRAVADQVVPVNLFGPPENAAAAQREMTREALLAIAIELES